MKRLIIVGSPRTSGRSAHLAEMLFEANIDEHPEDELFLVPVSEVEIGPCIGCNGCQEKSGVIVKGDDGKETTVQRHRCVFDDDMQTLYDLMDDVDQVTVVSPVYFSGAPAMLKCLLDRLQPYYWANARANEKRPAELHILGEGNDPHGYDALVSEVRSALAVAGFRLERILDWVGKINEAGEITAEAQELSPSVPNKPKQPANAHEDGSRVNRAPGTYGDGNKANQTATSHAAGDKANHVAGARLDAPAHKNNAPTKKQRPKLDLSASQKKTSSNKGKSRGK